MDFHEILYRQVLLTLLRIFKFCLQSDNIEGHFTLTYLRFLVGNPHVGNLYATIIAVVT